MVSFGVHISLNTDIPFAFIFLGILSLSMVADKKIDFACSMEGIKGKFLLPTDSLRKKFAWPVFESTVLDSKSGRSR